MYSLEEIFQQAKNDGRGITFEDKTMSSILNFGMKIQKFPSKIEILNCSRNSDYYQEISQQEYDYYAKHGWEIGSLMVGVDNCLRKLEHIELAIRNEVNSRKNDKHIQHLKAKREKALNKFRKINNKLKQLKNE